ncbi:MULTISPECIES: hypothetical protein [unclassified Pseudomonas]|uniref:hypothetical protein n=1 Tax=unclassified Pseudomonas TaxID=196821 RepID=UPI00244AF371|nr:MULTISPECIES: hypothetical protein [unclassified Pseudomonas]MDH0897220.1 antitoxin YezG family protein [Pseudomonas sp. GD03875]MDH1067140.1 antitoxin YezG family protein [Pseudomonas sp. GD03985]
MNPRIEKLQRELAQEVFNLTPDDWAQARASFMGITCFSITQISFLSSTGEVSSPSIDQRYDLPFEKLRQEMAAQDINGHAWYTAIFTLTPDGKFKFEFDYDHLPTFDIMPDPEDWLDEFKQYPRPELQAQIQDWIDGRVPDKDWRLLVERLEQLASR